MRRKTGLTFGRTPQSGKHAAYSPQCGRSCGVGGGNRLSLGDEVSRGLAILLTLLFVDAHRHEVRIPEKRNSGYDSKYRVGDVWEYDTRGGEKRSRFVVVKVETSPKLGTIVHIGVDNLIWKT